MSKRTIQIEDNLDEIVQSAIDDTKELMLSFLDDNPDRADDREPPCLSNDLNYSGSFHEIIDSAVPIYTKEIEDLFYLYGDDFERAFDNQFGSKSKTDEGWPMGWKPAAIYCYIEEQVAEHYRNNAEDWVEEWKAKRKEQAIEAAKKLTREQMIEVIFGCDDSEVDEETTDDALRDKVFAGLGDGTIEPKDVLEV